LIVTTIIIYLHKFDQYFMYKFCIVIVLHVDESIVFMCLCILTCSVSYGMCDLKGFMEFKIKWKWKWPLWNGNNNSRVRSKIRVLCTWRAKAHQGNWQLQYNRDFQELLSAWVEHITEWSSANWGNCIAVRLRCGCQLPWCTLWLKSTVFGM
jgi:hypothetical protein